MKTLSLTPYSVPLLSPSLSPSTQVVESDAHQTSSYAENRVGSSSLDEGGKNNGGEEISLQSLKMGGHFESDTKKLISPPAVGSTPASSKAGGSSKTPDANV